MFGFTAINSKESQGANSWFWASEPKTSGADGRTWSVLDIPILGWVIQLILSLFDSKPQDLEMEEVKHFEIAPKRIETEEDNKDEAYVRKMGIQYRAWREGLESLDSEMQINPSFLSKIGNSIKEIEGYLEAISESDCIRKPLILNNLKSELKLIKQAHGKLNIQKPIPKRTLSTWNRGFYFSQPTTTMVF